MAEKYVNFYENMNEAHIRLRNTVVLYDGIPHYIWAICNHKDDGIFRVYMTPCAVGDLAPAPMPTFENYHPTDNALGIYIDEFMAANPTCRVIRKMMNSPKFNRFRPFPLGMVNVGDQTYYLERNPQRNREQGLTRQHLVESLVSLTPSQKGLGRYGVVGFQSKAFHDCVMGNYPTAQECVDNLNDENVSNQSAAFDRKFALLRGPMDLMFLAYKADVIGLLPNSDLSEVRLGKNFKYLKEVTQELGVFNKVS